MNSCRMDVDETQASARTILPSMTRRGTTFRRENTTNVGRVVPSFGLAAEEEPPQPYNPPVIRRAKQEDEEMEDFNFEDGPPLLLLSSSSSASPEASGTASSSCEGDNTTPSLDENPEGQNKDQATRKKRSPYRTFTEEDVQRGLENHILYGMSKTEAAKSIQMSTATFRCACLRYLRSRGQTVMGQRRGKKIKFPIDTTLSRFVLDYVDKHPECTVKDIRESQGTDSILAQMSTDYTRRWLRIHARITFERFQCFNPGSSAADVRRLEYHQQRLQEITARADFDPTANVVFFAEAAFQINARRVYLADPSLSATGTSHPNKLVPHLRLILAVCKTGIIAFSLKALAGFISAEEMADFVNCVVQALDSAEEKKSLFLGFNYLPDEVATPIFANADQANHVPFFFSNESPGMNAADHLLQDLLYIVDRHSLDPEKREKVQDRMSAALEKITGLDCESYISRAFPGYQL